MKINKNWLKLHTFKIASYSSVLLNSICIILGIFYFLFPVYLILWDVFGVLLLLTFFGNLILIFINSYKKNGRGRFITKMNLLSYVYLAFIILAIVFMMLGNLLVSVTYSNQIIDNLLAYILISLFYFGTFILGIIYAILGNKTYNRIKLGMEDNYSDKIITEKLIKTKRILKKIITITSRVTFIIGIVFGIVILLGSFEFVTTFIAIISGQFGIFFSIIFFANTILLLKLKH
ncbi:MAG: hypothetical protein ACFE9C_08015, partial [Candidatus Hodarchaeota archaeon]